MAKKLYLLLFFLLPSLTNFAQVKLGIGLGMSTVEVAPSDLLITDNSGAQSLAIKLENANFGIHGGLVCRIPIKKFFIQPEVFFNTSSADFRVQDFSGGMVTEKLFREKYQNLDIPFLLGFKLGPLHLQGGPVGHLFINCQSELDQIEGYQKKFEALTYGWQAGLGLDIWKFFLDLNYEGNFSRFGEHINLFGKKFAFDDRPARIVATVGFLFGAKSRR
ncbi:MAG: PorT family protein [Saprospirales bacterium]|nr:PorT family protein [Saprospirales bacterium]MBK8492156.1 PorT family protein [Saprospirales bacterium]